MYRLEDRRVQSYFLGGKYPRQDECAAAYRALVRAAETDSEGMTLKELAAATALPEKKLKVITALLESSGVLRRGRRMTLRRRFADDDAFARYLGEYEGRHRSDRDRLDLMMRYGQTTGCRVRFLTKYFGNELANDCGRCDNCRTGAAHRTIDVRELRSGHATAV